MKIKHKELKQHLTREPFVILLLLEAEGEDLKSHYLRTICLSDL